MHICMGISQALVLVNQLQLSCQSVAYTASSQGLLFVMGKYALALHYRLWHALIRYVMAPVCDACPCRNVIYNVYMFQPQRLVKTEDAEAAIAAQQAAALEAANSGNGNGKGASTPSKKEKSKAKSKA